MTSGAWGLLHHIAFWGIIALAVIAAVIALIYSIYWILWHVAGWLLARLAFEQLVVTMILAGWLGSGIAGGSN